MKKGNKASRGREIKGEFKKKDRQKRGTETGRRVGGMSLCRTRGERGLKVALCTTLRCTALQSKHWLTEGPLSTSGWARGGDSSTRM